MNTYVMITSKSVDATGEKIQADGYYGYADGLHTIAIYNTGLTGRVHLQGTLASSPVEADWFDINLQASDTYVDYTTDTGIHGYTFQGNFVYLRIKLSNYSAGSLDKVLLKI